MFPHNPPRPDLTTSQFFKLYGTVFRNNPVFYKAFFYYSGLKLEAGEKHLSFDAFEDYYKHAGDYNGIAEFEAAADEANFVYPKPSTK
jgi:hypothetical protein